MLGAEQEAWLFERLASSTATWILLLQQVMLGQTIAQAGVNGGPNRPLFTDPWDGYDGARRRLYAHLRANNIDNLGGPDRRRAVQADWWLFGGAQVTSPDFSGGSYGSSWQVLAGETVLTQVDGPAPDKADPPPLAP